MDPDIGLPSLRDKSIELGYTDYPWGKDMQPNTRQFFERILDNRKDKFFFDDSEEKNNQEFRLAWFFHLERVCLKVVLLIPEDHKKWWYRNTDPTGDAPVLWKNGFSSSKIAKKSRKSTYLLYGKFEKDKRLNYDFIAKRYNSSKNPIIEPFTLPWGFCNPEKHYKHPSPKGIKVALTVLKQLKPESLIDPFCGSGSFLRAADILKIKWIGYDINKIYKHDVNDRFSQMYIDKFMEVQDN